MLIWLGSCDIEIQQQKIHSQWMTQKRILSEKSMLLLTSTFFSISYIHASFFFIVGQYADDGALHKNNGH